jgi:AcrR family transcriptional regulator
MSDRNRNDLQWREDAILSAALQLAEERGWRGTTVSEIAGRAGIAKGAVYKHFASKEDIYARLAVDMLQGLLAHLHLLDSTDPAPERLTSAIRIVFDEVEKAGQARDILFATQTREVRAALSDGMLHALAAAEAKIEDILRDLVLAGMATGSFAARPADEAAFSVRAAILGSVQQAWRDGDGPADEARQAITDLIVGGLRVPV